MKLSVRWLSGVVLVLMLSTVFAVESLGTLLGRARAARDSGDLQAATTAYDAMLAQVATHETALLERAQTLSWAGRYEEALAGYRAFKQAYPARALDADLRIAQVQAWADRIADALTTLQPWVNQGQRQAVLDDATYRAWDGDTAAAIERLRSWLEQHTDDAQARLNLARFRSWNGNLIGAETEFRALLQSYPEHCEAQLGLARMALWRSDYEQARSRLAAADKDCRGEAEAKLMAAQLQAARGAVRESVRTLTELAVGGAAQRDARELLFDDRSARGPWLELRQQRTDTNEGLRVERPTLRLRLPWLDGFAQLEAVRREVSFNQIERHSELLSLSSRQALGEDWRFSAGLLRDADFGGSAASAWNLGLGWRVAPGWNWQIDAARQLLDFTPAAIDRRGSLRSIDSGLSWTPADSRYVFNLGLGKAWLSAGSERESYFLSAERRLAVADVDWRVAARARGFGYSETLDLGFFNPERYRFVGLGSSAAWRRARLWNIRIDLQAGRQTVNDAASQFTWSYGLGLERYLADGRWALFAEWSDSRAGLPVAAAGDPSDYREHTVQVGLRWRGRVSE